MVFIRTSPFRKVPQYSRSAVYPLTRPTDNTVTITQAALRALEVIYKPGFDYMKAGVLLMDLTSNTMHQGELDFGAQTELEQVRGSRLMRTADAINERFGKGAVQMACMGAQDDKKSWAMRQQLRTPAYTTRLSDLPMAVA